MMLAGLAWRNLWRQPRRTLLNVISIAFAALIMVFLLSFQMGTYATMKENVLQVIDGYAQVQPTGYQDSPDLKKTIADSDAIMKQIETVTGVATTAPRTTTFAILSNGEKSVGAAVLGVDPEREVRVSRLNRSIIHGNYLDREDSNAIVLGAALARSLGVEVGDSLTLLGEGLDGSIAADVLTVKGIFESGTPELDRQLSEMPLARFQEDFAMDAAVNLIVVTGPTLAGVLDALPDLEPLLNDREVELKSWKQLQPGLDAAINLDLNTSLMWYASMVIVVVFIILNTLLMSVLERTREFGVLLSIGMRPGKLGVMIWMELSLLALLGLLVGIGLGCVVTLLIGHYGLELPGAEAIFSQWGLPGRLYPRLSLLSISAGPGAMALCIFLAGILPYRRVRRLQPVDAMRAA
ncbi:hypothetical protein BTA51_22120 [Hahella sp. CCB-MM4]|uniref:ABC transporter permease n=1 Tax=Hahella sp. (strain CCB-MM4) TaxID=1926491 RepID=UPI000B9B964E|nr:FtsX-like permease family protein [Hahella sp. CCB-MM4]OZG71080.1 hypothetical protein BTA51_22120 [Hahella sp. CCB-MM4]